MSPQAITDLVKDSKLRTAVENDITRHVFETSGCSGRQRKVRREERWRRDGLLGEGSFGLVWKEVLITGDSEVKERAVKMIRKRLNGSRHMDYARELEAIAKFSHSKVGGVEGYIAQPLLTLDSTKRISWSHMAGSKVRKQFSSLWSFYPVAIYSGIST
jgi:hypothetical protein